MLAQIKRTIVHHLTLRRINMETVVKEDEKEPKLSQNENDYTIQIQPHHTINRHFTSQMI